mgnify:CR=1 FL=1
MGYVNLMSTCPGCKTMFASNPHKVPSIQIDGKREAICRDCAAIVQDNQRRDGLPVQEIHPEAYEPLNENEL